MEITMTNLVILIVGLIMLLLIIGFVTSSTAQNKNFLESFFSSFSSLMSPGRK